MIVLCTSTTLVLDLPFIAVQCGEALLSLYHGGGLYECAFEAQTLCVSVLPSASYFASLQVAQLLDPDSVAEAVRNRTEPNYFSFISVAVSRSLGCERANLFARDLHHNCHTGTILASRL